MRRLLYLLTLLLSSFATQASHIVGGELALVHIQGKQYRYRVEMILYYDVLNGDTGGDSFATVRIFSKRNNLAITDIDLYPEGQLIPLPNGGSYALGTKVEYFQPACSDGSIETNRVFYKSVEFELPPSVYNDPLGYYMVYERCCRNYSIDNIVSDQPSRIGNVLQNYESVAGQIFYLEFPPVIKDGQEFINSSPILFPPLSDYACPNRRYFVDFAGTDADGDSLVYSLVTPLNSKERNFALPPGTNPGPYDSIIWKPGFSRANIMNGNPDLQISSDGLLTVTPTINSIGLIVFAVRCVEYRNGIKIGEVRRDFQMLVQNSCPVAEPPVIVGKLPGENEFSSSNQLRIEIDNTIPNANRCFEVKVQDPDALKFDNGFSEKVTLRAYPIGFKKNVSEVLPVIKSGTISNNGSAVFNICLPQCPYVGTGEFQLGIVAFDDACTLPLSDTLFVTVVMDYPPNTQLQFDNDDALTEFVEILSEEDFPRSWSLKVTDTDNDLLSYKLVPLGFSMAEVGLSYSLPVSGQLRGSINSTLTWNPSCDIIERINKSEFEFYFIVDDNDPCGVNKSDTTYFKVNINIPENEKPMLTAVSENPELVINDGAIQILMGNTIDIALTAIDPDVNPLNTLTIELKSIDGAAELDNIQFESISGVSPLQAKLKWNPECSIFKDGVFENTYLFTFSVTDNKCFNAKKDELELTISVSDVDGSDDDFLPPNIFTPNNDGKNEFFAMLRENELGELEEILPLDNCLGEFVSFIVFNRWGKQVFESVDRNFRWYGADMPAGVYYYYIKYTNKEYKGLITIMY